MTKQQAEEKPCSASSLWNWCQSHSDPLCCGTQELLKNMKQPKIKSRLWLTIITIGQSPQSHAALPKKKQIKESAGPVLYLGRLVVCSTSSCRMERVLRACSLPKNEFCSNCHSTGSLCSHRLLSLEYAKLKMICEAFTTRFERVLMAFHYCMKLPD